MKKRMNKIMHDLNISLETANAALRGSKAMGVKSYSINSVVSGKDEEKLQQKFGYKDKAKAQKRKQILSWMKQHKGFVEAMDTFAFEIAKGSWGAEDKFNAAFVKRMLKDNELAPDFTAGELLRVWRGCR